MSSAFAFGVGQSMHLVQCRMAWTHPIICMVASHPNDSGFASASSLSEPDLAITHLATSECSRTQAGFVFIICSWRDSRQTMGRMDSRLRTKVLRQRLSGKVLADASGLSSNPQSPPKAG